MIFFSFFHLPHFCNSGGKTGVLAGKQANYFSLSKFKFCYVFVVVARTKILNSDNDDDDDV